MKYTLTINTDSATELQSVVSRINNRSERQTVVNQKVASRSRTHSFWHSKRDQELADGYNNKMKIKTLAKKLGCTIVAVYTRATYLRKNDTNIIRRKRGKIHKKKKICFFNV